VGGRPAIELCRTKERKGRLRCSKVSPRGRLVRFIESIGRVVVGSDILVTRLGQRYQRVSFKAKIVRVGASKERLGSWGR